MTDAVTVADIMPRAVRAVAGGDRRRVEHGAGVEPSRPDHGQSFPAQRLRLVTGHAFDKAALAWADAVTLISHGPVPDTIYEEARHYFPEKEVVDLTLALVAINGWNRLSIAFRTVPGTYQPKSPASAAGESRNGAMA